MAFNPLTYFKESTVELGKVVWPKRNETARLTIIVIFVSIVIGGYIAGLDAIFTKLTEGFIGK